MASRFVAVFECPLSKIPTNIHQMIWREWLKDDETTEQRLAELALNARISERGGIVERMTFSILIRTSMNLQTTEGQTARSFEIIVQPTNADGSDRKEIKDYEP